MAYAKPVVTTGTSAVAKADAPIERPQIFDYLDQIQNADKKNNDSSDRHRGGDNKNARLSGGKTGSSNQHLQLCIKGVPSHFDETKLCNLLKQYGSLVSVNKSRANGCPYYFAYCSTENDCNNIIRGMEQNLFDIKVEHKTFTRKVDEQNSFSSSNSYSSGGGGNGSFSANDNDFNRRSNKDKIDTDELKKKQRNRNQNNSDAGAMYSGNSLSPLKEKNDDHMINFTKTSNEYVLVKSQPGLCRTCENPSFNMCARCDEFYCSRECQTKDWSTHRFFCFKMPNLVPIKNVVAEDKQNKSIAKSSYQKNEMHSINGVLQHQTRNVNSNNTGSKHSNQNNKIVQMNGSAVSNHNDCESKLKKLNINERMERSPANKDYAKCSDYGTNKNIVTNNQSRSPEFAELPISGSFVILTHQRPTNMVVYIRSLDKNDDADYLNILGKVREHSVKAKFLTKLPNKNEFVIAEYEGEWYRAMVTESNDENNIKVLYVDFGNTEIKKLSELKELPLSFYDFKRYAFPIYLKNIENFRPNEKYQKYIDRFIDNIIHLKIKYDSSNLKNGAILAELWESETGESLNNKCKELLIEERVFYNDLAKNNLPEVENILLIITDKSIINSGLVSCITPSNYDNMVKINLELKKYAERENECYTPRENEMCIAKISEGVWHRAKCFQISDEIPQLLFIDYGNLAQVAIKNIRKYPKSISWPCCTYECQIAGLEHLLESDEEGKRLESRLNEILPINVEINVAKVVKYDEDHYLIHLPRVINILKSEGLL